MDTRAHARRDRRSESPARWSKISLMISCGIMGMVSCGMSGTVLGYGVLQGNGDGISWSSGDDNRLGSCRGVTLCFRDFRTHSKSESWTKW